ncbi:MAG: hypothetical protein ACU826_08415 [Gammaproteobacteria bacterium]
MSTKVGVLILHGIGLQQSGYSAEFQNGVQMAMQARGLDPRQVDFQEVVYSDLFDEQQIKRAPYLLSASSRFQIFTRLIRSLLIYIFSDAISYRARYKEVHQRISKNIEQLQKRLPDGAAVVVVTHSMGTMAVSDYIYDQQENKYPELNLADFDNLKGLVTLACNIPLFQMGFKETLCIKRPATDHRAKDFFWTNFYSPFDVLGYKIADYYSKRPNPKFDIDDRKVFAGNFLTKWNVFSHLGYWSHARVHDQVVDTIEKHI